MTGPLPTGLALGLLGAAIAVAIAARRPLGRWWLAPLAPTRLAALRLVVGTFAVGYLGGRFLHLVGYGAFAAADFRPVGVVDLLLDRPLSSAAWTALVVATTILAVAFAVGAWHRWLAPAFAALLLFTLTYRNSFGMVFHTENLLVLHVAILAVSPAADAWSVDAWRRLRRGRTPPAPDGRYAWAVRTAAVVTVSTYVLAGIARLRLAGDAWLGGEQLRNQIAIDNLRKHVLGDRIADLAVPLLEHPGAFTVLALATLVVELGAPVALVGGRVAGLWIATAWGFHVGVVALMNIWFPYPLALVAYAPLVACDRPIAWALARIRTSRARPAPAGSGDP
ncbi:MAG: HTTM domain-containing protein [Kofleriaceae bacterium]